MIHLIERLNALHRPRLLIQAARIGASTYRRELHLSRLFDGPVPRAGAALEALMEMEDSLNQDRKDGSAAYCAAEHVDLLIAMMGEGRLMRASLREAQGAIGAQIVPVRSANGAP